MADAYTRRCGKWTSITVAKTVLDAQQRRFERDINRSFGSGQQEDLSRFEVKRTWTVAAAVRLDRNTHALTGAGHGREVYLYPPHRISRWRF